jgi:hypothetical protein
VGAQAAELFVELAGKVLGFVHFVSFISIRHAPRREGKPQTVLQHGKAKSTKYWRMAN